MLQGQGQKNHPKIHFFNGNINICYNYYKSVKTQFHANVHSTNNPALSLELKRHAVA